MVFAMITNEFLSNEFIAAVEHLYPKAAKFLHHCHVRVINTYWGRPPTKALKYVGIYCPDRLIASVQAEINLLREVAKGMGLTEVVCLNATRLIRDPMSSLKQTDSRFWLELCWISK